MRTHRFNGAAGIHRRKLGGETVFIARTAALQWGRRNSPAETQADDGTCSAAPIPLQWGRRNSPAETPLMLVILSTSKSSLQWGRRNSPAETVDAVSDRRVQLPLQWGRRNSPAETCGYDAGGGSASGGFNGAAGIHRRKLDSRSIDTFAVITASMGPPEFTGGNNREMEISAPPIERLQWGRRNSPAETRIAWKNDDENQEASMGPPEFTGGNIEALERSLCAFA